MSDSKSSEGESTKEDSPQNLDVPKTTSAPVRSRSPSPSVSNSTEFRLSTQMSRLSILQQLHDDGDSLTSATITLEEIDGRLEVLNNAWGAFETEHEQLGTACRRTMLQHPYMVNKVYENAFRLYHTHHSKLHRLKAQLHQEEINSTLARSTIDTTQEAPSHWRTKLPEIKLPQFNGDFTRWPAFRDLFTSLVIENKQLSKVEKLHYLKTSTTDSAAQLIQNSPMPSDSFDTAWKVLIDRFNDKDRLIMAYLDQLLSNLTPVKRTAHDLDMLVSSTIQIVDSLNALGAPTKYWDHILIYVITHRLDSTLREAWEVRRTKPTNYNELLIFIQSRARALEAVESTASVPSTQARSTHKTTQPVRTSHHVSTHSSSKAQYPCDHCQEDHYIVTCPKFRDLTPSERHRVVVAQKLCFNCLGHHNLAACNSKRTCKTCGRKHHTMIHSTGTTQGNRSDTQSTSTSAT